jgi:hypothetical protein
MQYEYSACGALLQVGENVYINAELDAGRVALGTSTGRVGSGRVGKK